MHISFNTYFTTRFYDFKKKMYENSLRSYTFLKINYKLSVLVNGDYNYNFKNLAIVKNGFQKYFGVLHLIFVIVSCGCELYGRLVYFYKYMSATLLLFDFISLLMLTVLNLIIIVTSGWINVKKIDYIIKTSFSFDDCFQFEEKKDGKRKYINNMFLILAIILLPAYDCYVWIVIFGNMYFYYIWRNIQFLMVFVKLFLLVNVGSIIEERISFLEVNLKSLVTKCISLPVQNIQTTKDGTYSLIGWTKSALRVTTNKDYLQLDTIIKHLEQLCQSWKCFKFIYSLSTLGCFFLYIMEFLQMNNFIIAFYAGNLNNSMMHDLRFVLVRIFWMLIIKVKL